MEFLYVDSCHFIHGNVCGGNWKDGRVNLVASMLCADLSRPHSYFMVFSLRCVSVFLLSGKMNIMIWMHGWLVMVKEWLAWREHTDKLLYILYTIRAIVFLLSECCLQIIWLTYSLGGHYIVVSCTEFLIWIKWSVVIPLQNYIDNWQSSSMLKPIVTICKAMYCTISN